MCTCAHTCINIFIYEYQHVIPVSINICMYGHKHVHKLMYVHMNTRVCVCQQIRGSRVRVSVHA